MTKEALEKREKDRKRPVFGVNGLIIVHNNQKQIKKIGKSRY